MFQTESMQLLPYFSIAMTAEKIEIGRSQKKKKKVTDLIILSQLFQYFEMTDCISVHIIHSSQFSVKTLSRTTQTAMAI